MLAPRWLVLFSLFFVFLLATAPSSASGRGNDPRAHPPHSWHDLVPQPPDADSRPRVVTWQTRTQLDLPDEQPYVDWLARVQDMVAGTTDFEWAMRSVVRVPHMPGTANWTSSDPAPIGTWGVFGQMDPFPPANPGPPPFANRSQPTFRSVYPGRGTGSIWPPPVWYRREALWRAWLMAGPDDSRALLWHYQDDDQLIESVEDGFVLSSVAALSFNFIADDVEAMSSAIYGAVGVVAPPAAIARYRPMLDSVRDLETLVAYMDDVRWQALNHLAYVRMLVGPLSALGIHGFGPVNWNYPSAPGRSFADALVAYHVLDGRLAGTLIDTRAPPEEWPSMQGLADARIPFWWLQGMEESCHERESAMSFRNFVNHNLPNIFAERAAIADARRRRALRGSEAPYRPAARAVLVQDRGKTISLFLQRIISTVADARENLHGISVTTCDITAAARAFWIRRYEYVRGYPRANDITFLNWRPLRTRHDMENGREADPATWNTRLQQPNPFNPDADSYSQDEDYDSDGADAMLFADARRWPAEPDSVFARRPERPPARASFPSDFAPAPQEWAQRFRVSSVQPMEVDPSPLIPEHESSPPDVSSTSQREASVPTPGHSPADPPPVIPHITQARCAPEVGLCIHGPPKGKGKAREGDGEDTVGGFSADDLRTALENSARGRGPVASGSQGESSSSAQAAGGSASWSGASPAVRRSALHDRMFPAPNAAPAAQRQHSPASVSLTARIRNDRSVSPRPSAPDGRRNLQDEPAFKRHGRGGHGTPASAQDDATLRRRDLTVGSWPDQPPRRALASDDRWRDVSVRWPANSVAAVTDAAREMRRISPVLDTRVVSDPPTPSSRGTLALPVASRLRLWWWTEQHPFAAPLLFVPWALARGISFRWAVAGDSAALLPDPLDGASPRDTLSWSDWVHDAVEVVRRANARAFVWDGGIAWRLALQFRRNLANEAGAGPSSAATTAPAAAGWPAGLVTDTYTTAEINMLIGRRRDGLSWWPHPDIWDAALGIGEWWSVHEEWFNARLTAIISDKATPVADGGWYANIRNRAPSTARPILHAGNLRRAFLLAECIDHAGWQEVIAGGVASMTLDEPKDEEMGDDDA